MQIVVSPVLPGERDALANLVEKYLYEFTLLDPDDVDDTGNYGYAYLDDYFKDERRWAYFFRVGGKLAGFCMVNNYAEPDDRPFDFCMCEFFVMHKYRRHGVGKQAFYEILKRHSGVWKLGFHPKNPAAHFWKHCIAEKIPAGKIDFIHAYPTFTFGDGTHADMFFFDCTAAKF